MKTLTNKLVLLAWYVVLAVCAINLVELFCVAAYAQDVATNSTAGGSSSTTSILPIFSTLKPIEFLLIPAVTVLIQLARKLIPAIPAATWPWVAPFIGALLDYLASKAGLWTGNVTVGIMLGGLGTWFHQLDKQSVNVLSKMLPDSSTPPPTTPSAG